MGQLGGVFFLEMGPILMDELFRVLETRKGCFVRFLTLH